MYRIFGRASKRGSKTVIVNPKFEHESKHAMQGIIPVYPIPKGAELNQNVLRYAIRQALDCTAQQPEIYPEQFRERYSLPEINFALENIHFPRTFISLPLLKSAWYSTNCFLCFQLSTSTSAHRDVCTEKSFCPAAN